MKKLASILCVLCICFLSVLFVGCGEKAEPRNDYTAQTLYEDMCNAEYFKSITATSITYKQSNVETNIIVDATTVYVKQTKTAENTSEEIWLIDGVEYKAVTNLATKAVTYSKTNKTYLEKMAEFGSVQGFTVSRMQDVVKYYALKYTSVFTELATYANDIYTITQKAGETTEYKLTYSFKTGCFASYEHVSIAEDGTKTVQESIQVKYYKDGAHKYPKIEKDNWK